MKRMFVLAGVLAATGSWAITGPFIYGIHRDSGVLYKVGVLNAEVEAIGATGIALPSGLEFTPDGSTLYAISNAPNHIYRVDAGTGASTLVGGLGSGFQFEGGLAFASNTLAYFTNGSTAGDARLFKLDLPTLTVSEVGNMGAADINGLAWRDDGMLVGLDRVSNALVTINPHTAVLSTLATIPDTVGSVGGMTVYSGFAYFATSGSGGSLPGSNSLYATDLYSGSSFLVGAFPPAISGLGLSGLAAVPEPATLLALGAGLAALLRRRR